MDMLTISNLHKSFGDKQVLRGVDLNVPEGSIFGFIGKNGAGKTTTMKAVLGLIKADEGELTVAGEPVKYGTGQIGSNIGYLPDVPQFYTYMNAREYLTFCGQLAGMDDKAVKSRADELLSLVGLAGENHKIKGYSRGMKQRLGIAQALFARPKLLICDEPTSALDPIGRKDILEVLSSARQETTVLLSTHILSDIERICTDVAFLNNGVISVQGKLSDIKLNRRGDEFVMQLAHGVDINVFLNAFAKMRRIGDNLLSFYENEHSLFEVMGFISANRIPIVKLEHVEATLESLFMEVLEV